MWVPPQGYAQPQLVQPTMEMLQNTVRNHVQREEWARFNAPPPQDNVYFEDNFSVFEGSTMRGYQNVAPRDAASVASNRMHQGQAPPHQRPYHNQMNPPVPQVIGAQEPMGPMPLNGGRPNHVGPQGFQNAQPSQMFVGPRNNNVPTNVAFHNGPQPQPSPMFASPRNNMYGPSNGFRNGPSPQAFGPAGFRNGQNPQSTIPRTNSNLSRASVARSVVRNHAQPMFTIPRTNSNLSRASVARSVARNHPHNGVGPSPYGMPENAGRMPAFMSPRQQKFTPTTLGIPEEPNAPASSFDEDPPPYHDIKFVPEEKSGPELKMSCMATIFGSSIEELRANYRCNELNISTTCADEFECRDDAMTYFSHSQQNGAVKKCTGVRGPGKKFDYIGDRRTDSMDTARESKLTRCLTEKTEKFLDGLQMENLRISEGKEKVESVAVSPRSFSDESNEPVVPTESEDQEAKSVSSLVYSEDNNASEVRSECRDDTCAPDSRSEYREAPYDSKIRSEYREAASESEVRSEYREAASESEFRSEYREEPYDSEVTSEYRDNAYDSEVPSEYRGAVASFVTGASIEDESTQGGFDRGYVTIDYVPRGSLGEESSAEAVISKYEKFIQRMEKQSSNDTVQSSNDTEHSRSLKILEEEPVFEKDVPSFDEMSCPSFDKPTKKMGKEVSTEELPKMCTLSESSSDGENNPKKANIWMVSPSNITSKIASLVEKSSQRRANIWTISTSNEGTLKINKGAGSQSPFGVRSVVN